MPIRSIITFYKQDIPFLVFRLYMMIVYREIQQMIIFFTGKNALVVILQLYRIIVLKVIFQTKFILDFFRVYFISHLFFFENIVFLSFV